MDILSRVKDMKFYSFLDGFERMFLDRRLQQTFTQAILKILRSNQKQFMNVHKAEAIVQSIYMYLCLILAHLDFIRILNYTICNRYTINLCTSEKQNTCVTFNNIVQETCYFYVKHLLFSYLQTKQESPILSRNPSSFLCCSENSIEYIQYSIYINI